MRAELAPERLLVFDIESDAPERLCEFIGVPRAYARHYRVENPSLNRFGEALAACLPFAVKRALPARAQASRQAVVPDKPRANAGPRWVSRA